MPSKQQFCDSLSRTISGPITFALALAIVLALTAALPQSAHAQTYKVLYNFTGGADGAYPAAALTLDSAGNLYGTADMGGAFGGQGCDSFGCGTVFKLARQGSAWEFSMLHTFQGAPDDGALPWASVIFGPDGALYGTTIGGGAGCSGLGGCGTVFKLRPPLNTTGNWTQNILYSFTDGNDGEVPEASVIFDQAGNLYGTTSGGSVPGGTVFMLSPSEGNWTESTLVSFTGPGGSTPMGGVILDRSGDVYGTTMFGGATTVFGGGWGLVYELTPSISGWKEKVLHTFPNGSADGFEPYGSLIMDGSGNLYGVNAVGGLNMGGTVFMLSPSGVNWMLDVLYKFDGSLTGANPLAALVMDADGSLYGTTQNGSAGPGIVFKLTRSSGGGWTETTLHEFNGSDGANPYSSLVLDTNGNLYGTTTEGGTGACNYGGGPVGCGVVFEITP